MKTKRIISTMALAALTASGISMADDIGQVKRISEGLNLIGLEQAQAKALEAKPGVIDDVDLESRTFSKGWDYEFEIVDIDGNEWEVHVDAKTGEVRKIERDWF